MSFISKQILGEAIFGFGDKDVDPSEFIDRRDEVIDHGHGIVQKFKNSNEYWYKNGKLQHVKKFFDGVEQCLNKDGQLDSAGDLLAVVYPDGTQYWYKNGKLHRDGDKPAIIWDDGSQAWYKDGKLHRDGDKPAIIWADGTKKWYRHGVQYR